jgi:hypothetical protein
MQIHASLKAGISYALTFEESDPGTIYIEFEAIDGKQQASLKYELDVDTIDDYFSHKGDEGELCDILLEPGDLEWTDYPYHGYIPTKARLDEVKGEEWVWE